MKRVAAFLVLASAGLSALVFAAGGVGGKKSTLPDLPGVTLDPAPPATGPSTTVRMDTLPLGPSKPKNAPRVEVQPLGAFSTSITEPHDWVDPVTRERVPLPYYTKLSLRMDAPSAEPSPGAGVPWFRWDRVHVTGYRDPSTLTRREVDALLADPANRRDLVLYEIDAAEGSANVRVTAIAEGQKALPARFVLKLTKDVRIHVVPDDVHLQTSDLVIDQGAGTIESGAEIVATGPGFTASGTGLRLDKASGRVELLRNVLFRAEQLTDERGRMPALDLGAGPFRPRLLRTQGSVVLVRHDVAPGRPTYEVVLSDDVHVEATDGSSLSARRVVLDVVPRDDAKPAAARPPSRDEASGLLAPPKGRHRLRSMVAEGDVRVRGEERPAADGTPGAVVTIETDRLSGRFDDPARAVATLEGRTVLSYAGLLTLPGGSGTRGTVVARCRQGVTYGPPVTAADARLCDVVVDLVGAVEIDGTVPPAEGSQRLTAERVRLLLRQAPAPARKAPTVAGAPTPTRGPAGDLVAVAFLATGDDVRISGPVVSGRAHEMKAYDLDQPDGWRLVLTGPDAYLEVDETTTTASARTRAPGAPVAAGAAGPKRARETWVPDRLEATGGVRGALAPRPGDVPVAFAAQTLTYTEADGGELRGAAGAPARLTYPGAKGRDQGVEAPVVGFRVGDDATRVFTRGGTKATVWTDPRDDAAPPRKARRTVVLRGGSALEIHAGRTAAAESTVTVAARDGASLENRVDGVAGDRLEAGTLSVTLARRVATAARPAAARPGNGATAAPRPGTRGPPAAGPLGGAPTRWTLACEDVDVELAGAGAGLASLRSFVASGQVVAASDAQADGSSQRFEGARLTLRAEGDGHRGRLEGTVERRATLSATDETLPQWIASPTVDFVLDGVSMASATFAPPVSARFHHRLDGRGMFEGLVAPGAPATPAARAKTPADAPLERVALRADAGPLTIERKTAGKDGLTVVTLTGTEASPVVLARSTRDAGAREFGPAVKLASPRIELTMKGMLGVADAAPEKFVATGPGTRVEIPSDEGPIVATGHNLTFDRSTWELRLDGPEGVYITKPRVWVRGRWFSYNVKTGARDVGAPSAEAAR